MCVCVYGCRFDLPTGVCLKFHFTLISRFFFCFVFSFFPGMAILFPFLSRSLISFVVWRQFNSHRRSSDLLLLSLSVFMIVLDHFSSRERFSPVVNIDINILFIITYIKKCVMWQKVADVTAAPHTHTHSYGNKYK